jgi:hypothetical protein
LCIEKGLDKPEWNQVSGENTIVKTLWNQYARLKVINGVLYRQWIDENGINNKMLMLVPESLKGDILKLYHDVPTAGHLGMNKIVEKIKKHLYWPSMKDYVTKYCNSCDSCATRKPSRSINKAPLGKYVVGAPIERVCLDIFWSITKEKKWKQIHFVIVSPNG